MKSAYIKMTDGSLFKNILIFSIPLIFSNILQILFNIVDISVVGRFANSFALGAVGSTSMLILFFTGMIMGIANGVNAIVAYYIGANSQKDVDEIVISAFVVCLISGIILMIAGIVLSRPVLILMKTKSELLDDAVLYFRIYMIGLPALAVYNYGYALLSAIGDTKTPVVFLVIAGIINVALDLYLVIVFHLDAVGVGIASVVSLCVSAVLIMIVVIRGSDRIKLSFSQKVHSQKIIRILKIGIPAGLQNSIFSFANMFIQAGVNNFDAYMVAGNTVADKADALVYNIMGGFYTACATFISQNFGARKKDRILKSYLVGVGYSLVIAVIAGILLLFFGPQFLSVFTNDRIVIEDGMRRLHIMAFSYWISAFMDCTIAANRGLGKTLIPVVFVLLGSCVFRIIWIYTIFAYFQTIPSLFLLYTFSWAITATAEIIYFAKQYRACLN